jgi:hypothetical protein
VIGLFQAVISIGLLSGGDRKKSLAAVAIVFLVLTMSAVFAFYPAWTTAVSAPKTQLSEILSETPPPTVSSVVGVTRSGSSNVTATDDGEESTNRTYGRDESKTTNRSTLSSGPPMLTSDLGGGRSSVGQTPIENSEPRRTRVRSVVRSDPKSGHLIRVMIREPPRKASHGSSPIDQSGANSVAGAPTKLSDPAEPPPQFESGHVVLYVDQQGMVRLLTNKISSGLFWPKIRSDR